MKRAQATAIALAPALAIGAAATADVVSIGEFTGDHFETFEGIGPPQGYPGPVDIFGGAGTVNDPLANTLVVATSVSSADTGWENFFPYDGFMMGLTPTGWTTFRFDTPVTQFGGYFGSAAIQSGGDVTFYDEQGGVISSESFEVPPLEWGWYGWESDVAIGSIEIRGSDVPGKPLVFDNLQITLVPAPGALALLGMGALLPGSRRRRATSR